MPESCKLRSASTDDIAAVQRLADRVWRAHYPGIITVLQIDYMLARGYATEALRKFIEDERAGIELAEVAGELAGFAAWCVLDAVREVKLDKLYIDPVHQRQGIGRALIERVAAHARALGASGLVLNVNKHNTAAQRAYERNGFAIRQAVVVDIGGGFVMDDYVMARGL